MQLMKRLVFLVLLQALMAGAAMAQAKAKATATPAMRGTAVEAKALTEKAAAHIKSVGTEKAFADFNALDGKWVDRDLYIIVVAFDGTMLVHGTLKPLQGKPQLDMKDINGKYMTKEMIEVAKTKDTGWVDYQWPNPVTKKFEAKSTYVLRIPGFDGFVGVGAYK